MDRQFHQFLDVRKRRLEGTSEEIEEKNMKRRRINEDEDDELIDVLLPVSLLKRKNVKYVDLIEFVVQIGGKTAITIGMKVNSRHIYA